MAPLDALAYQRQDVLPPGWPRQWLDTLPSWNKAMVLYSRVFEEPHSTWGLGAGLAKTSFDGTVLWGLFLHNSSFPVSSAGLSAESVQRLFLPSAALSPSSFTDRFQNIPCGSHPILASASWGNQMDALSVFFFRMNIRSSAGLSIHHGGFGELSLLDAFQSLSVGLTWGVREEQTSPRTVRCRLEPCFFWALLFGAQCFCSCISGWHEHSRSYTALLIHNELEENQKNSLGPLNKIRGYLSNPIQALCDLNLWRLFHIHYL